MPSRFGSFLTPVTNPKEFAAAIRSTLGSANMLAANEADAKARLTITWQSLDLPFRIGSFSSAVAPVRYDLRRADNGQTIFSREIATQAHFIGGNAAKRAKVTARAAIRSSIASATLCLDKAAFGLDPEDRALTPVDSFSAPITVVVQSYNR